MKPGPSLARESAILVALIALSYPIGLAVDPLIVLPLANALPAWWFMARRLRAGDLDGAIRLMLVFPVALAVFGTVSLALWPTADGLTPPVFNGPQYRAEMFNWIRTGVGAEGDIRQFLPQHITHLIAFIGLSLATGSLVSIVGGAVLTNYMDGYVASIHRAGAPLWGTVLFGWQPWAICRVAGFCILGVVLASPLLSRVLRYEAPPFERVKPWLLRAAGLILLDWTLKALLAPTWGLTLRPLIR